MGFLGNQERLLSWQVLLKEGRDCDMVKKPERVLTVPGEVNAGYRLV